MCVARRVSTAPDTPETRVVGWRHRTLLAAGFADGLARRLAAEPAADLHAVLELVDRGCPPQLAARIRGPLRDGAGA